MAKLFSVSDEFRLLCRIDITPVYMRCVVLCIRTLRWFDYTTVPA